jgi:hypothetical protein
MLEFTQQNLANLAWAYGKLGHYHQGLLDAIAARSLEILEVRNDPPQYVGTLLGTLAEAVNCLPLSLSHLV